MKKSFFIILCLVFGVTFKTYSQSFNVRRIFNSGATGGVEILAPSRINDSTDFSLNKHKVQFVKVLRTKEVDIEKFDMDDQNAKANQLFLISRFSFAKPELSRQDFFETIYNGELELIYITLSRKRGAWLHNVNVSATESKESIKKSFTPNFRAYSVYAHVKNLDFVPFLGPAIGVNQGRFFVLPVVGFWTKLSPQLTAEIIAPIHAKIKYNLADKVEFEIGSALNAFQPVYREGSNFKGNDRTINLRQFKNHLGIGTVLSQHYKIKIELGHASFQKIRTMNNDFSQDMESSFYVNLSFNYNFGNSILYNFFNVEKPGDRKKNKK
ncbi:MAG: hypothetical protein ACPGSL_10445 [Vicingaceae bacterium]